MTEKTFETPNGVIHYWTNGYLPDRKTLVFLPGLTADHRLFEKQTEDFMEEFNLFVWDAPGHALSRPFRLDFTLMDKAKWLHEILQREGMTRPILIGQSMGGYVAQCFLEQFKKEAAGFVSIDSAPLKRCYVTGAEIWMLKRTAPIYKAFPWNLLIKVGSEGCSVTQYGQELMKQFIHSYSKEEYIRLSDHGYGMLSDAMAADLPYVIDCPAILICGMKDQSGSAKSYNRRWAKKEGLTIYWIENAGHNSNTDQPDKVDQIIREFVNSIKET